MILNEIRCAIRIKKSTAIILAFVLLIELVGCAEKQPEYDTNSVIAERAVSEFMKLTKISRPSYHLEKVLAYLQS